MNIEYNYEDFDMEVSMLELIIGLAYRCESIMADQDANVQMDQWFWHILGNIDLDKFRDESYYDLGGSAMVNNILDRVINRTYYRSGKGGLFPLKYSKKDQRDVELWYQMSSYLVENYYNIDYKIV
jgi:hypothetical protein